MRFLGLTLENFGPFHGKHVIDFSTCGKLILVTAEYLGSPGRSNRAGKSTVLEALEYLLYGKTRVREVDFISHGADQMLVSGKLQLTSQVVSIVRGRTASNKAIFSVDGDSGPGQQEKLNSLFGISHVDFVATNYFKQLDMHGFMEATPADKKKQLNRWLGNSGWSEHEVRAKARVASLIKQLIELSVKLEVQRALAQGKDADFTALESTKSRCLQERESLLVRVTDVRSQLDTLGVPQDLTPELCRLESAVQASRVSILQRAVDSAVADLATYNKRKVELDILLAVQLDASCFTEQERCKKLLEVSADKLRVAATAVGVALANVSSLTSADGTGVCPVLRESCDKVSSEAVESRRLVFATVHAKAVEEHVAFDLLRKKLIAQEIEITKQCVVHTAHQQKVAVVQAALKDPKRLQAVIDSSTTEVLIETQRITALEAELVTVRAQIAATTSDTQHADLQQLCTQVGEQYSTANINYSVACEQLAIAKSAREAREEACINIVTLEDEQVKLEHARCIASFVCGMVGKDGIPLLQIENTFEQLEGEVNIILEALGAECRVEFCAYRELTTKEASCSSCGVKFEKGAKVCVQCSTPRKKKRKDDMSVRLVDEYGRYQDFAADSGGGKALVSLAVRPALSRILQRQQQNPCNLLLLDEVMANFDFYNRQNVMTALFKLFVDVFNFEQVFIITHTDISDCGCGYDELRVTRENDASKVGWVI